MSAPMPGPMGTDCLRGFPGVVLRVAPDGAIVESNGRLEAELGHGVVGLPFSDLLDADSTGAKWARLLGSRGAEAATVELVLAGRDTLGEPRPFSVLRVGADGSDESLWLVEHPRDERLDRLREQVTEVNSELANTQRALLKERARLAHALAELERRNEELEETTRELERSNEALDEFAHVVSHDLKAPLRGIGNYARWIEEDHGAALPDEVRSQLSAMCAQVARMRAMIDGVLSYARAGREQTPPREVDVGELVDDIVALVDPPPGMTIEVERPMPRLVTEPVPLGQVLQNLVDNAVKHARRADAHVRVSARPDGEWIEFAVADDGPGIPARMQSRIWALFHTAEPTDGAERTGIGLALVRRLVEAKGGTAWVESEPGHGATFRFRWPAYPETGD